MRAFVSWIAFLGLAVSLVPDFVDAQDGKDNPKKSEEKKADGKKKALAKVDENTILYAPKLMARVKDVHGEEKDGDAKEIVVLTTDQQKFGEYLEWEQKFLKSMERLVSIETGKPLDKQQKDDIFRRESANKLDKAFTGDMKSINVTPSLRIRTAAPPPQYDKKGAPKKLTATDLAKLKDRSRLPGYPADISALRPGQIVELYVPKSAIAPVKQAPPAAAKKGVVAADPNLVGAAAAPTKIDAYLLYVLHESP